jgi:hypothetical protein
MRVPFALERLQNRPRPFERRRRVRAGRLLASAPRFPVRMVWRRPRAMGAPPAATAAVTIRQISDTVHVHPRADVVRERMHFVWLRIEAAGNDAESGRRTSGLPTVRPGRVLEQASRHVRNVVDLETRISAASSLVVRNGTMRVASQAASPLPRAGEADRRIEARPGNVPPMSFVSPMPGARTTTTGATQSAPARWPQWRLNPAPPAKSAKPGGAAAHQSGEMGLPPGRERVAVKRPGAANSPPQRGKVSLVHPTRVPITDPMEFSAPNIPAARRNVGMYSEPVPAPLEFRASPATQAASPGARESDTALRADAPAAGQAPLRPGASRQSNVAQPMLDRATIDRLAEDVIRRIERRGRIERERRGL